MKAELLKRIKEQIEKVISAPPDSQPGVLEIEATGIAKTVMESQAALDNAKKVSTSQILSSMEPSRFSTISVSTLTLTPNADSRSSTARVSGGSSYSPSKSLEGYSLDKFPHNRMGVSSPDALNLSTLSTEPTTWGRMSNIFGKRKTRATKMSAETLLGRSSSHVASLCFVCHVHVAYTFDFASSFGVSKALLADNSTRLFRNKSPPTTHYANSLNRRRRRTPRKAR